MSFILDALKKSEGERQRASGPALFEVKVAPPRTRFPVWALAVAGLLVINLGVVAWLALRGSTTGLAHAKATSAQTVVPTGAQTVVPTGAQTAVPTATPAVRPPSAATRNEPATRLAEAADPPTADTDLEPGPELFDLQDDEPALPEPPVASGRVTRGTTLGVPTYEQVAGTPGASLPDLRLDLHVFANEPADRFVFLNNARLREGEALPDGTRVESIVPDGVILTVRGTRLLLQRQ